MSLHSSECHKSRKNKFIHWYRSWTSVRNYWEIPDSRCFGQMWNSNGFIFRVTIRWDFTRENLEKYLGCISVGFYCSSSLLVYSAWPQSVWGDFRATLGVSSIGAREWADLRYRKYACTELSFFARIANTRYSILHYTCSNILVRDDSDDPHYRSREKSVHRYHFSMQNVICNFLRIFRWNVTRFCTDSRCSPRNPARRTKKCARLRYVRN